MAHDRYQRPVKFMQYCRGHRTIKRRLNAEEKRQIYAWIEGLYQKALLTADALLEQRFADGF